MKNPKTIIVGIAGLFAAGKTTAARFLERQFGFSYLRYSLLLKQLLEERGEPTDDANLQAYGQKIFEEIGGQDLSDLLMQQYDPSKNYVIDGLRHISDYQYFEKRFDGRFHLVYLEAPEEVRKERFITRNSARNTSVESFLKRSTHPVEQEVPLLRDKASAVVVNIDFTDLISQVSSLVLNWMYRQRLSTMQEMLEAVRRFHEKHNFPINTSDKQLMYYRMGLLMEELGEINECLSKGRGNIGEEHADLLILLLGNCVTLGLDLEEEFWKKYETIMQRKAKLVEDYVRVSLWGEEEVREEVVVGRLESFRLINNLKSLMRSEAEDNIQEEESLQLKLFDV